MPETEIIRVRTHRLMEAGSIIIRDEKGNEDEHDPIYDDPGDLEVGAKVGGYHPGALWED